FTGSAKADLLRLNMAIAPTHPVGQGDPLGVLNGDLAGFPNGRRLEDDVTDIELRAVADGYGSLLASLFGLPNHSPNNQIGDGVNQNDMPFLPHFPMSRRRTRATSTNITWWAAPRRRIRTETPQRRPRTPGR